MSISDSALIVDLNISVWTANIVDRKVTDELLDTKNASHTGGRFKKNLMAGTSLRKQIEDHAARCRLAHNINTLPWADKGSRLLPTRKFMDYKQMMNANKALFDSKVEEFVENYEVLILEAEGNLGDLFDRDDYPLSHEVAGKFAFKMVFSPVPESGDFRLDIPKGDLEEVQKLYDESFKDRVSEAMRDPWKRLHKMLTTMAGKLDSVGEKTRFHDSFVENAHDMCDLLRDMNLTQDRQMRDAEKALRKALSKVGSANELRESEYHRDTLNKDVKSILEEFEW